MIATIAFSMGIDNPKTSLIIHAGLPISMCSYLQAIGRASRYPGEVEAIAFYKEENWATNDYFVENAIKKKDEFVFDIKMQEQHELLRFLDEDTKCQKV